MIDKEPFSHRVEASSEQIASDWNERLGIWKSLVEEILDSSYPPGLKDDVLKILETPFTDTNPIHSTRQLNGLKQGSRREAFEKMSGIKSGRYSTLVNEIYTDMDKFYKTYKLKT